MPAYTWCHTELSFDEFVPNHHVVDHIRVVNASLIMHAPAGIQHLKSARPNQLPDSVLELVVLLIPPHGEELHLNVRKALFFVEEQLTDNTIEDEFYLDSLDAVVDA